MFLLCLGGHGPLEASPLVKSDLNSGPFSLTTQGELIARLRPYNVGCDIGESNMVDRPASAGEAFAPDHWQRLADLRDRWDPEGVFFGCFDGLKTS